MAEDLEFLKKRLTELARKAEGGAYYTFTDFLGLPERSVLASLGSSLRGVRYEVFGGAEGAERVMVRFGDEEQIGYPLPFPIVALRVAPVSQKFAEKLTHRDFLGSLLALGIERDVLGDIAVIDNVGYVFAKEDIAPFICDSLFRVRHTEVTVSVTEEPPCSLMYRTEERRIQISGQRLDAVLARVLCLSREDAQKLFAKKLVYVDGRLCESVSYTPKSGEKISVRGYGKMIYRGVEGLTRKGKLNVTVEVYI